MRYLHSPSHEGDLDDMSERPKCCSCEPDLKTGTRVRYDAQWVRFDERVSAERRKHLAAIADPLLRMILPFSGKTVVDLGIGTGSLAFRAAELSPPETLVGTVTVEQLREEIRGVIGEGNGDPQETRSLQQPLLPILHCLKLLQDAP